MADKFRVMEGTQVIFSSDDEELCKGVAQQKKIDLVHRGCDIRDSEFRVHIAEAND